MAEKHPVCTVHGLKELAVLDDGSIVITADAFEVSGVLKPAAMLIAEAMARTAANLFCAAGSHLRFPGSAVQVAELGDTAKAGMLAAAIELRDQLSRSTEGREALRHLGFQKLLDQVERERAA